MAKTSMLRGDRVPGGAVARLFTRGPRIVAGIGRRFMLKPIRNSLAPTRIGAVEFGHLRRVRPISPNFGFDRGKPLDRRYIEDFLSHNAQDIRGHVLEVADNAYTLKFGGTRVTRRSGPSSLP